MSDRITWSSRPRGQYPWPLRTKYQTVSDLINDYGFEGIPALFGPFTLKQLVEFIYRISKIAFTCSIDYQESEGDPWTTVTREGTLEYIDSQTELDIFKSAYYDPADGGFVSSEMLVWSDGSESAGCRAIQSTLLLSHESDIFLDEDGLYWSTGRFALNFTEPGFGTISIEFGHSTGYSVRDVITVPFNFADSTANIQLIASSSAFDISNATLELSVSEWFPYKTTSDDPAWNTATGAPINGGPGA